MVWDRRERSGVRPATDSVMRDRSGPLLGACFLDTTALADSLSALARNHHWVWSAPTRATLDSLPGARPDRHPAATVAALTDADLDRLLADDDFVASVERDRRALAQVSAGPMVDPEIAYFSPEFGVTESVPQYSGGLGILAGDHLKAASDLALPLVGVGLFYRHGFFRQRLVDGRQAEHYDTYDAVDLGCVDAGVVVEVPVADRVVRARVWRVEIGRIPLILLDTDIEGNSDEDRRITDRLYSGDRRHRIEQEVVLGVGGSRALTSLGWHPPVFHLNEGHAGFLILDLLDREISGGASLDQARDAVRRHLIFTTHTPVPAGIDRFSGELAAAHLVPWATDWDVPVEAVFALGAEPDSDEFNMAAMCLRSAGRVNGVSELHGAVSRELFADIEGGDAIGSITNGVHARSWVSEPLQAVFDGTLGPGWADGDPAAWGAVADIDDDTIRSVRRSGGEQLADMVRARTGAPIDPDALVVGFARRFATYKRATLLLRHPDRLAALLGDDDRPVTFVFAGKAHPANAPGKESLAGIVAYGSSADANGRFVFVPDYDISIAKAMYAGCDVWLNTPIRPHEASGTSGEKSALNGGCNLSISDGWWDEMADGRNGWVIPASDAADPVERDDAESAAVFDLLEAEIVPEYHADGLGQSAEWLDRVRHVWATLGPQVTAARMVAEYRDKLYQPAARDVSSR